MAFDAEAFKHDQDRALLVKIIEHTRQVDPTTYDQNWSSRRAINPRTGEQVGAMCAYGHAVEAGIIASFEEGEKALDRMYERTDVTWLVQLTGFDSTVGDVLDLPSDTLITPALWCEAAERALAAYDAALVA